MRDAAGNLYGTTVFGGGDESGTVFKLDAADNETILHRFTTGADGAFPRAGLIADPAGNLYGTTEKGGVQKCGGGCGVVFKLNRAGV